MEFVRFPTFEKSAAGILSEADILELEILLTTHPDAGDRIPGGRGLRKLRRPAKGRGKRGGARLIYYHATPSTSFSSLSPSQKRAGRP